tara:strand:+ start:303 stop:656 length:354 start_codon:yes stop_codon:yes gene_type:complete
MADKNSKAIIYKVVTATTLVIPFDPDNPDKVDAVSGMVRTPDGMVIPLKDCLESLIDTAISFGIEYDELTGMGTQVEAGITESRVVGIEVLEKNNPEVKLVIDTSTINPVQTSRTIN